MEKKQLPLVSVITTVYNTEKYVERCFDSIMNQTYDNIEFIVVDNASTGNIQEIVRDYQKAYPKRVIKLVQLEENVGLFHGRLKGAAIATGDYIAFIDSDDRISLDYYRVLVECAEENDSDMTAGSVVLEFSSSEKMYENLVPQFVQDLDLSGDEILRSFWEQEGGCYYWHLVWNKIYRRDLFERAKPLLNLMKKSVIMCDDMAYSTVFYSLSKHMRSTSLCQYYYYKREDAYTANTPDISIIQGNIDNIISVFDFMSEIQRKCNLERYKENLIQWKRRMFRTWCRNVDNTDIPNHKKKELQNYLLKVFEETKIELPTKDDNYFYQCQTTYIPFQDHITEALKDSEVEYISFDIFDTLVMRPFFEPIDLFTLMNKKFQQIQNSMLQIDFCKCRQISEQTARENLYREFGYEEVTLDEIYDYMAKIYHFSPEICSEIKELEISLELRFCVKRQYTYEIYRQALALGKKIICTSDMYLPRDVIEKILRKNGYSKIEHIFLSSDYRQTKHNGSLYKSVLKRLNITPKNLLHIGDNVYSDINVPEKMGFKTIHIPKAMDCWGYEHPSALSGNFFFKCFKTPTMRDNQAGFQFLGNRCVQGMIANHIYNNPFCNHNVNSDFNVNPYNMGYTLLGPYLLAMVRWLYENADRNKYDCIHFVARDGFLLHKAYNILQPYLGKKQIQTNYLHVSRKAMIPLMIQSPADIFTLDMVLNYTKSSPKSILKLLSPIIEEDVYVNAEKICTDAGFIFESEFKTQVNYFKFLNLFNTAFYSQAKIQTYRADMKAYFASIIGSHDCFFDIGYSGRTEGLLKQLLGYHIDTFYLHLNGSIALENARINEFKVFTFFDYSPILPGPIRELLFSSQDPSCIGYEKTNGMYAPIFSSEKLLYLQSYSVSYLQKGAIDFLEQFVNTFRDDIITMPFRNDDLTWPMEYFLGNAQSLDLTMFNNTEFEDDLFLGTTISANQYWLQNAPYRRNLGIPQVPMDLSKWKKAIVLLLIDRKELKEKVKHRYAKHPILLGLLKVAYSIPRAIYHLIK